MNLFRMLVMLPFEKPSDCRCGISFGDLCDVFRTVV